LWALWALWALRIAGPACCRLLGRTDSALCGFPRQIRVGRRAARGLCGSALSLLCNTRAPLQQGGLCSCGSWRGAPVFAACVEDAVTLRPWVMGRQQRSFPCTRLIPRGIAECASIECPVFGWHRELTAEPPRPRRISNSILPPKGAGRWHCGWWRGVSNTTDEYPARAPYSEDDETGVFLSVRQT
jgi:hypothetical protein